MSSKFPHPRAGELRSLATIVAMIQATQADHPGYCQDVAASIANVELRRLEEETRNHDR